jgi:hypothetical protein
VPRFFFHVANGQFGEDQTRTDLPDIESARVHALAYAERLRREHVELLQAGLVNPSDRRLGRSIIRHSLKLSGQGGAAPALVFV